MQKTSDKHRSISERLRRAKSPESRSAVLEAWVKNWEDDQMDVLAQIEAGIRHSDRDTLASAAGQLRAITDKRMAGLRNVLRILTEGDQ